ncbi:MAG: PA14 domain-containing protein, partial [Planctomycetota bacterium]|nr:PA14 domain-containing protein [Planctomycetota bacterium]
AAIETFARLEPTDSGIVSGIHVNVPQVKRRDKFALQFSGLIQIDQPGRYTFYTRSDDGSRLYIGDRLVVNNDGRHVMTEKKGAIKLAAGSYPLVVTYFDSGGSDGLEVHWSGPKIRKQQIPASKLAVSDNGTLRDLAIEALASIPGHQREKFRDLVRLLKAGRQRTSAIRAMQTIPSQHWDDTELQSLADNLLAYLSELPTAARTAPTPLGALALVRQMADKLPAAEAQAIKARLEKLDVRVITIGTVPHRMIYDKERMVVQAGQPVAFQFSNTDSMPHNFCVTRPGSMKQVGMLAEATATEPDAMRRQFIPNTDRILLASRLLQPGESQMLGFDVPTRPGVYPYVCTYPGHWRRMYGALYVVDDVKACEADPKGYLARHKLRIKDNLLTTSSRGREWTFGDLVDAVSPLQHGRNFEVGKQVFKAANCVACHRLNGEGQQFGPDFTQLDPQKQPRDLLRSLLEPSHTIEEKYRVNVFELVSGKVVSGMVVEETPDVVKIVTDPLVKPEATPIKKSDIDFRQKAEKSLMPEGLLNILNREEILDLLAYVYARGDKKHKLFHQHHHH